ncbi:MAG: glycosyltransferase family 4 protein, partial [Gemmatimonadaceae bacterium]|nr:glycosyltransferase family 4 protein [Acetobacteraceae bacterium]
MDAQDGDFNTAADEAVPTDAPDLSDAIRLIDPDPLFDHDFYARVGAVSGSRHDLIEHYLTIGEPASLSPSADFDARFYRATNRDVAAGSPALLLHYLRHGRAERRYANHRQLRQDAALIEASGLFDARAYTWGRRHVPLPGLTDIEDYLAARDPMLPIGDQFDSAFYMRAYPDARAGCDTGTALPILHYLTVGKAEMRLYNGHALQRQIEAGRTRFNENYYLGQFAQHRPGEALPADPLMHYILTGCRLGLDPAPDFSADYYTRRYTDLRGSGMDPFSHYAAHGWAEGRVGRPNFDHAIRPGGVDHDTAKPTILIASHEASRTGAPLVGLNVGARLADTHNVIAYLGKAGPIEADFAAHSCTVVVMPMGPLDAEYLLLQLKVSHGLSAVLLNSVETSPFAAAALQADLPSVALVHEFAEYTLPVGRMSELIEAVDRVMTPAALTLDSLQAELLTTRGGHAGNIMVRPQGYLPNLPDDGATDDLTPDEILALIGVDPPPVASTGSKPGLPARATKIVLGAGYVQMRKGVDLFVQTAAEVRRLHGDDVRFVWVGAGYEPTADLQYSAWVADMVRRLDLERHVFFVPAQSSLDRMFALSDVFYLPSRLDPFPNVVLDAFKAGRAVVCFDRATGAAMAFADGP